MQEVTVESEGQSIRVVGIAARLIALVVFHRHEINSLTGGGHVECDIRPDGAIRKLLLTKALESSPV